MIPVNALAQHAKSLIEANNPLHAARRAMAAALPPRGAATGFSKLTFSYPEPVWAVIVGYYGGVGWREGNHDA